MTERAVGDPAPLRFGRVDPVVALTAVLAVASAATVVMQLSAASLVQTGPVLWPALAAAFFGAEIWKVHLRVRRDTHSLSLSEIPLVFGLVFAAPAVLVATRAVGAALALVLYWRMRGVKLAFNVARLTLEAGLAAVVYRAVLAEADPLSPRGWAAAFAAMVTVDIFAGLVITTVLSLRGGRQEWRGTTGVLTVGVVAAGATTSLALVGVLLLYQQVLALGLLGVLAVMLFLAYRAHTSLAAGHASLAALYDFTKMLSCSVRSNDVVATTLAEARTLLRAEVALLVVPTQTSHLWAADHGRGVVHSTVTAPDLPAWVRPALGGGAVLLPRHVREREASRLLQASGYRDVLGIPLLDEGGVLGVLVVANRVDDVSTFDDDDCRLLETLGNAAIVALRNGRLVEQLLDEAAEKERRALHDPLTGLPNRTGLARRLDAELCVEGRSAALLHVALGGIADVRDVVGHETGDDVLVAAAQVLEQSFGGEAVIARLSGDDLAVLVADVADPVAVEQLAYRVADCFLRPVNAAGLEVPLRATIGAAVSTDVATDSDRLLHQAEAARHAARDRGATAHVHSPGPVEHGRRRLALVADLAAAIRAGDIQVVYQPKVSFQTGRPVGVEALARWQHAEHGWVSPVEFVTLAEGVGLIRDLTMHVLDTALAQCAAWRAAGLELQVAVNLSMRNLHETALCDDVARLLARHAVPAPALILEITEGSVMTEPLATIEVLQQLRGLGVTLAVDDFGTGYSSLSYLSRLPVDELKIDRSFVSDLPGSGQNLAIVRAALMLAHDLGLTVVAEGIEDAAAWRALAELGCDLAQGYFVSRPLAGSQVAAWVADAAFVAPHAVPLQH